MPIRRAALALLLAASPVLASARTDGALAHYLKGRVAAGEDSMSEASRAFASALAVDRQAPEIRLRAFETALVTGDLKAAARLADELQTSPPREPMPSRFGFNEAILSITRAVHFAQARDWRGYDQARMLFREPQSGAVPVVSRILEAYGRAARGQFSEALALLDAGPDDGLASSYFAEHRAHVLALARRWPEAAEAYGALVQAEGANVPRLRMQAAGAALEAARSDPAHAIAWREKAVLALGGGPERDPLLADARARLLRQPGIDGKRLGGIITTPGEGLAQLFLRLAVDASRERPQAASVAFGRFAIALAPGLPETWLVTGDMLARVGLTDLALDVLARVPAGPYAKAAAGRRGQVLAEADRVEEALALLTPVAESPEASYEDWVRVSDVKRRTEDFAGAAAALDRALALLPDPKAPETAYVWFLRGSAHEQAGDWARAEPDLRVAVDLQPDNAVFLNYLGYSLLDRNQRLDEAEALIARAFAAAPDNGAIIDSMGWAAFVRGRYAEAVELLEQARAAEPSDPTVADHLGDALWRVGRRIEARHAWNSALTLDPSDKVRAAIERKLRYGLDIALTER
ncbi:MAG: tetratricopeptide repeat protein [Sphingomonadaceae bacterium]